MILIPAGEFVMGEDLVYDPPDTRSPEWIEGKSERVFLGAYYIDKVEVTNALYKAFVDDRGYSLPRFWQSSELDSEGTFNRPDYPICGVSYFDAQNYCAWAGLRLPTAAEWEKAARGSDGQIYPWGNTMDWEVSNAYSDGLVEVGHYPGGISPYGVHDLVGNAREWVGDPPVVITGMDLPREPLAQTRGGSFHINESPSAKRPSIPFHMNPESRSGDTGFRCAQSASELPTLVSPTSWGEVKLDRCTSDDHEDPEYVHH